MAKKREVKGEEDEEGEAGCAREEEEEISSEEERARKPAAKKEEGPQGCSGSRRRHPLPPLRRRPMPGYGLARGYRRNGSAAR